MKIEQAIKRINGIKWDKIGTNTNKAQKYLGYEYLRRLANFCKGESVTPTSPFAINIAKSLGDDEDINISNYLNEEAIKYIEECRRKEYIIGYYIQLCRYADINDVAKKYINVYEPLIRILEVGGMYELSHRELAIMNIGSFPLGGWYDSFIKKEPIDIENLHI